MKKRVFQYRFVAAPEDGDRVLSGADVRAALEDLYGLLAQFHFWMLEAQNDDERDGLKGQMDALFRQLPAADRTVCVARFMGWADEKGRWVT